MTSEVEKMKRYGINLHADQVYVAAESGHIAELEVPDYIVLKLHGSGEGVDHGISIFPNSGLKRLADDLQAASIVILEHVARHGDSTPSDAIISGQTTWTEDEMPHPNAGAEPKKKEELE